MPNTFSLKMTEALFVVVVLDDNINASLET